MSDEEFAIEFAADTESAVANVREFITYAQGLADTAKEAADGIAGIAEPAAAAGDAIKATADSSDAAAASLAALADEQKQAAAAAGDLAAAQATLKAASGEVKDAVASLAAIQVTAGKDSTEYATQLDAVTAAMGRQATAADTLKGVQEQQAAAAATAKTAAEENATAQEATVTASDSAAAAATTAGTAQEGAATKADAAAAGGLARYRMALVGIGVGAAVAVDAAGKFQDQTTHLVTDAGESAQSLGMVQQGILGVSASTGTSASAITDAMYHIESSGFHAASGLAILKTTAEGAKVGGAELDTTSKALVGTLTAYYGTSLTAGQATKDSTQLMNELITTVGSGDMRMQDLASSLSNVTPVAAAAHVSFAQVGGALATMTAQGMSARQASQNLAHAIRSLTSPTNVQSVEMKAMGLNANDVAKNLGKTGLAGTLNEMRDAVLSNTQGGNVMLDLLKGMSPAAQGLANQILAGTITTHDLTSAMKELNPEQYALVSRFKTTAVSVTGLQQTYTGAMSKMVGGATGLNVALMLTGTHMGDLKKSTAAISAEGAKASSTVDNWSTIQATFNFKMEQAKASLQDTGIALGSALLPAVTAILGPIAHFLALIASNRAAAVTLAVVIGGILAGALGLKLAKSLKDAAEGIKAAGEGIEWLIGKMTAAKTATEAQAAATETSKTVQEAAAAESEAQAVATEALTVAKEESVGATEAATVAQDGLNLAMLANPITLIIVAIIALVAGFVYLWTHSAAFRDFWIDAWKMIKDAALEAWHFLDNDVIHPIMSGIDMVVSFVKDHWQLLATILATILLGPVAGLVVFLATHWKQVTADVSKLVSDVTGFFERLPGEILGFLEKLPGDMLTIGHNIVMGLLNGIESMGSVLANGIESLIPSPIRSIVSTALGIFSPSTVFHGFGQNIVQGLINGVRSRQDALQGTMAGLAGGVAGTGSAYAASAIAPAGGSTSVHVNVPVTATGATAAGLLSSPQYKQALQAAVQEVTLEYAQLNQGNGLNLGWGR